MQVASALIDNHISSSPSHQVHKRRHPHNYAQAEMKISLWESEAALNGEASDSGGAGRSSRAGRQTPRPADTLRLAALGSPAADAHRWAPNNRVRAGG